MSRIDLSGLPAPDILTPLDYEAELAQLKAELTITDPQLAEALTLESEPLTKILELLAYRLTAKTNHVNHTAKSMLIAYASGTTLEHLAAGVGIQRLMIELGNPNAVPPIPDQMESDTALRRRIQLEPESASAGSKGAYLFWALSADGDVRDASVVTASPGRVTVYVQSHSAAIANDSLRETVRAAVDTDQRRPFTDNVRIAAGQPEDWSVQAELTLYPGPDKDVVIATARAGLDEYIKQVRYLGYDVTLSGLYHALHKTGVQRVSLLQPIADINLPEGKYANCIGATISAVEYRDV